MPKINSDPYSFPDNRSPAPHRFTKGLGRPVVECIPPDVPHPSEYVNGEWLLDTWTCGASRSIRIHVATPEPLPRREAEALNRELDDPIDAIKLGPAKVRDYQFEPGVPLKIPTVHRGAVTQVRDGVIVGGLLPSARLLGTEALPIDPRIIPAEGPTVPKVPQPSDGAPMVSSALFEADDTTPEARALARARERRGA
jgi:hypothetical protein